MCQFVGDETVKIAFGSCARRSKWRPGEQVVWSRIREAEPDYLFLLGDQIYMDYGYLPWDDYVERPKTFSLQDFRDDMADRYSKQWDDPHFTELRAYLAEKSPNEKRIFGVWDDHDFAWNGACGVDMEKSEDVKQHGKRDVARELFQHWMNSSTGHSEVYSSHVFPGIKAIFLDNRYHATKDGSLLGTDQLAFLEQEIQTDCTYTLVCAGVTLTQGSENFKRSSDYAHLERILTSNPERRILFLGGDIHKNFFGPASQIGRDGKKTRPVHEVVSSGIHINYLGLPWWFDDRRNWGLLTLNAHGVEVRLHSRKDNNPRPWRIPFNDWNHPVRP